MYGCFRQVREGFHPAGRPIFWKLGAEARAVAHRGDVDLARRCAQGDREALETLVDDHYGAVLNFVHRMTGRRDEAHDITQEVFVKALRALGRYSGKASLRTWLFTVAANATRDSVRRRSRRPEFVADLPELSVVEDVADPSDEAQPDRRILGSVRTSVLQRALLGLPEAHRTAVILRFYHGLSLQEIADVCGCSIGTVGSRLHYGILKLRQRIEGDDEAREELGFAGGGAGT